MRFAWLLPVVFAALATISQAQVRYDAEAVRLNNRGVAQMGQQFTERAAGSFADAFKKDPKLAQAAVNEGIALFYLQKPDETEKWIKQALTIDPSSARAWYNLGLAQHASNELDAALASFQQASKIDPADADSYYFQGVCYQEMKKFDEAVAILAKALAIDSNHASAEFATARALQRSGHTVEAKVHFQRFQHLTSAKISSAIGLSYGEQGHYSTVEAIQDPETGNHKMIPVQLVAQPLVSTSTKSATFTTSGGACMLDVTGSGAMDLVLMQSGEKAIRVLHNKGDGSFEGSIQIQQDSEHPAMLLPAL